MLKQGQQQLKIAQPELQEPILLQLLIGMQLQKQKLTLRHQEPVMMFMFLLQTTLPKAQPTEHTPLQTITKIQILLELTHQVPLVEITLLQPTEPILHQVLITEQLLLTEVFLLLITIPGQTQLLKEIIIQAITDHQLHQEVTPLLLTGQIIQARQEHILTLKKAQVHPLITEVALLHDQLHQPDLIAPLPEVAAVVHTTDLHLLQGLTHQAGHHHHPDHTHLVEVAVPVQDLIHQAEVLQAVAVVEVLQQAEVQVQVVAEEADKKLNK
jgi:hypothetical protein